MKAKVCTLLVGVAFLGYLVLPQSVISTVKALTAGIFFVDSIDASKVVAQYEAYHRNVFSKTLENKIKILVVPGHDNQTVGTMYGQVGEVELNRQVANYLADFLEEDDAFIVTRAHVDEEYNQIFLDYFATQERAITEFQLAHKRTMGTLVDEGTLTRVGNIQHNVAPSKMVTRLYGINKWLNENAYDMVIHVHFNDYPGHPGRGGKYNGFAIYYPEKQLSNARASKVLAQHVKDALDDYFPPSDFPKENGGMVESQDLIAVGAFNTLDAMSVLIEYGYIYEKQFTRIATREVVTRELAFQTYRGIRNFFGNADVLQNTLFLDGHVFDSNLTKGDAYQNDVLVLQAVLREEGLYPPEGSTLNDCPISGKFGTCTERAVKALQEEHAIDTTGYVGPQTREVLNSLL